MRVDLTHRRRELAQMARRVEESRQTIVCHPDDEANVRQALARLPLLVLMPNVTTSPSIPQGSVVRLPSAREQQQRMERVLSRGKLGGL